MKVLNVSNHKLSAEQIQMIQDYFDSDDSVEIVELPDDIRKRIRNLPPDISERAEIAVNIINFIDKENIDNVHADGEAHFVHILINYIYDYYGGYVRIFKFYSERKSVEETLPDGSVIKKNIFKPICILEY